MAALARHLLVMGLRRAARAPPDSPVLSGGPTFSSDTDVTSCGRGGARPGVRRGGPPAAHESPELLVRPEVGGSRRRQCTWVWVWKQVWVWREPGPVGGLQVRAALSLGLGLGLGLGPLATTPLAGRPALAAPPSRPPSQEDVPRFRRTANGVRYEDVIEGSGSEAKPGDSVQFNYVCRRSNGYFVYSTVDPFSGEAQPATLPLGEGKMILGLEEVLYGMRPGGKRRALVPPSAGYVSSDLEPQPKEFGPRRSLYSHAKEPLVFEVQLLKVI
eukprot:SM000246S08218  [mRNA]  locus=s246:146123:148325:- [translate_table: standard]